MFSLVRINVFFLIGRRSLAGGFIGLRAISPRCSALERLFAVLVVLAATTAGATGGCGRRRGAALTAASTVAGTTALHLVDLGGRAPPRRCDVVGDDLDDRALLTRLGLPAALLEPAADDDARALRESRARVLGQLAPGDHVEEAGLLLPLLGLLVPPRPIDGDAEAHLRHTARRVAHFRIASDVARDRDAVRVR